MAVRDGRHWRREMAATVRLASLAAESKKVALMCAEDPCISLIRPHLQQV